MRRTPLRSKRPTPRRKAPERAPGRMKPKQGEGPSAEERRHIARVAAMPCLLADKPLMKKYRCAGRTTVHHVSSDGYQRITRSPRRVTPLCERHHQIQHGSLESVEALSHFGFSVLYGIDLLAEADRLWAESQGGAA